LLGQAKAGRQARTSARHGFYQTPEGLGGFSDCVNNNFRETQAEGRPKAEEEMPDTAMKRCPARRLS